MDQKVYICENCGKEFTEDWRKDKGVRKTAPRFCCRSCANTRKHSKETKDKISKSLLKNPKVISYRKVKKRICVICGKEFILKKGSTRKTCSDICNKIYTNIQYHKVPHGGLRKGAGRGHKGIYKGYYCDSTYELAFVIYNLDHNIFFKRSTIKINYNFKGKNHLYYPDFELEDGSLVEIKGYHTEVVDVKLKAAKNAGYNIKILYGPDLKYAFDYVRNKYQEKHIEKLYDNYNIKK